MESAYLFRVFSNVIHVSHCQCTKLSASSDVQHEGAYITDVGLSNLSEELGHESRSPTTSRIPRCLWLAADVSKDEDISLHRYKVTCIPLAPLPIADRIFAKRS